MLYFVQMKNEVGIYVESRLSGQELLLFEKSKLSVEFDPLSGILATSWSYFPATSLIRINFDNSQKTKFELL